MVTESLMAKVVEYSLAILVFLIALMIQLNKDDFLIFLKIGINQSQS
jgi:hypothetical protein